MKIKDGTIDLGPPIPIAIRFGRLYPRYRIERFDIFKGYRASKSFVIFQNFDNLWTIANGHGLIGGFGMSTPENAYNLAQDLETLPINWNIITKHCNPQVMELAEQIIQDYTAKGLL